MDTFKSIAPIFALARLPLVRDVIRVAVLATWLVVALVVVVLAEVLVEVLVVDLPVDLPLLPEAQALPGPILALRLAELE